MFNIAKYFSFLYQSTFWISIHIGWSLLIHFLNVWEMYSPNYQLFELLSYEFIHGCFAYSYFWCLCFWFFWLFIVFGLLFYNIAQIYLLHSNFLLVIYGILIFSKEPELFRYYVVLKYCGPARCLCRFLFYWFCFNGRCLNFPLLSNVWVLFEFLCCFDTTDFPKYLLQHNSFKEPFHL